MRGIGWCHVIYSLVLISQNHCLHTGSLQLFACPELFIKTVFWTPIQSRKKPSWTKPSGWLTCLVPLLVAVHQLVLHDMFVGSLFPKSTFSQWLLATLCTSRTVHWIIFLNADSVQEVAFMNKTQPLCVTGLVFFLPRRGVEKRERKGSLTQLHQLSMLPQPHSEPGTMWGCKGPN